ncbi:integrase core domain-containing protein [Escherichia coli]
MLAYAPQRQMLPLIRSRIDDMAVIIGKRVYRIMRQNALFLERKPAIPPSKRAHRGKSTVGGRDWECRPESLGFSAATDEQLRITFARRCSSRKALHWAASTGGYDSETLEAIMLDAVERRFGKRPPAWGEDYLANNGSAYRSHQTRQAFRMVGLEPKHTAVRSPESNGMVVISAKPLMHDCISVRQAFDGLTAAKNLAEACDHCNEWHQHGTLGYRSPREYLRLRTSNGLSDKKCLEI